MSRCHFLILQNPKPYVLRPTPYTLHDLPCLRRRDAVQLCPPRPPHSSSPPSLRVRTDVGRRRSDSDEVRVLGDALWSQVDSPPNDTAPLPHAASLSFPAPSLPLSLFPPLAHLDTCSLFRSAARSRERCICNTGLLLRNTGLLLLCNTCLLLIEVRMRVLTSANTPLLPRARILSQVTAWLAPVMSGKNFSLTSHALYAGTV